MSMRHKEKETKHSTHNDESESKLLDIKNTYILLKTSTHKLDNELDVIGEIKTKTTVFS